MKQIFGAYLEDYHYIKVIIPNNIEYHNLVLRRLDQFEGSTYKLIVLKKLEMICIYIVHLKLKFLYITIMK
jgi:hypothetical protein